MLGTFPQVVPFATRVALFTALRDLDRARVVGPGGAFGVGPTLRFTVRRDALVDDSFKAFAEAAAGGGLDVFKARFQVEFINKEGLAEAGIDGKWLPTRRIAPNPASYDMIAGGGLLKEFVDSVVREAFSHRFALFCTTPGTHR